MTKLKTAVLVSGGGTNLQALIDYQAAQAGAGAECPYEIVCVISDSKKAFALERASAEGHAPRFQHIRHGQEDAVGEFPGTGESDLLFSQRGDGKHH